MHKTAWCVFQTTWLRGLVATIKNTLRDRALPCLAGHVAEVLVVGVAIDLRLERVERGAECLGLARLAVDLLVGPGLEVGSVVSGKGRVSGQWEGVGLGSLLGQAYLLPGVAVAYPPI